MTSLSLAASRAAAYGKNDVTFSCSVRTCVHYWAVLVLSEALWCVEVSTELSHHCRHVVGGRGLEQVFYSLLQWRIQGVRTLPSGSNYILCLIRLTVSWLKRGTNTRSSVAPQGGQREATNVIATRLQAVSRAREILKQ